MSIFFVGIYSSYRDWNCEVLVFEGWDGVFLKNCNGVYGVILGRWYS